MSIKNILSIFPKEIENIINEKARDYKSKDLLIRAIDTNIVEYKIYLLKRYGPRGLDYFPLYYKKYVKNIKTQEMIKIIKKIFMFLKIIPTPFITGVDELYIYTIAQMEHSYNADIDNIINSLITLDKVNDLFINTYITKIFNEEDYFEKADIISEEFIFKECSMDFSNTPVLLLTQHSDFLTYILIKLRIIEEFIDKQ